MKTDIKLCTLRSQARMSILSSVSAKALVGATVALSMSGAVARADDCGNNPVNTCTNSSYPNGITYTNVDGLILNLANGVNVTDGVDVGTASNSSGAVHIDIDTGSGTITSDTNSTPNPIPKDSKAAVKVLTNGATTGDINVKMDSGTLQTNGPTTYGVLITNNGTTSSSDLQFDFNGGTITVLDDNSIGGYVDSAGTGAAIINMSGGTINVGQGSSTSGEGGLATFSSEDSKIVLSGGTITVNATDSFGAFASTASTGNASVQMTGGSVSMLQDASASLSATGHGLIAYSAGSGIASVTMSAGQVTTVGKNSDGLLAYIFTSDSSTTGAATVTVSGGTVSTTGENAYAAAASTTASGNTNVTISSGSLSTEGAGSYGAYTISSYGASSIDVRGGSISTKGDNAYGAFARLTNSSNPNDATINMTNGSVTTGDPGNESSGTGSHGLYASNHAGGQAYAAVFQSGSDVSNIHTYGANAYGVFAESTGAPTSRAVLQGGTIQTEGDGSHGLVAIGSSRDAEADYYWGDITTNGDGAHGVYAKTGGGGKVSILVQNYTTQGQSLTTTGNNAYGAYAYTSGNGAIEADVGIGTIKTTGESSYGVAALIDNTSNTSSISAPVETTVITTQGKDSHGLFLKSTGSGDVTTTFQGTDSNGGSVSTTGNNAHAVYLQASQGGSARFKGAAKLASTTGSNSHAIYVTNQDGSGSGEATIDFDGGHVSTSGSNSNGLYAEALGSGTANVTMHRSGYASSVKVSGSDAFGVSAYSQGAATTVSLDAATITATGNAKAAVGFAERWSAGQAATQATITFGSNLVIDASAAAGQHAFYNADDQAGTNMNLTTWGTVTGSANMGGGNSTFTLAGGSFTGNIYGDFDPSETPAANQGVDNFIWSGGTLNSGFYGQGGNDTATIYVPGSSNFAAAILDGGEDGGAPVGQIKSDIDQVTFAANNDSVAGRNINNWEKFTVNENVAIKFIDDGMTLDGYDGGNANGMGDLYMLAGSSVTGGAGKGQVFTLSGNLSNKGLLTMQDGAYGGNFVVEGDYTSDGGTLGLDVDFGDLKADVLTVGKDLGGVTQLEIAEVGTTANPGAILIVDTTTGTGIDKNEFTLDKNQMTASGIYAYGLVYSLEGDPGNGYPPGVYLSATGAPGPTPPGPNPRLQPFVPLYEGYQSALLDMNTLPTMRQRVGKRAWLGREVIVTPPAPVLTPKDPGYYSQASVSVDSDGTPELDQNESETTFAIPLQQSAPALENVWGRISGDFSHLDPTSTTTGYKYDLSTFEMQAGVDGLFYDDGPGALVGGLTVHYRTGEAKFDSVYGDSKVHPDGYGFGGTLTWYGDNGFYTDGQVQATWYSSELKADDLYKGVENSDAFGYAVSVEAGQQFLLDSNDLILTPQGQLAWSSVDIDSFTGAYNDDATFDNGDSLKARLGLAVEKEFKSTDANGLARRGNIYGIANIYHEFMGETKAVIEQSFTASSELDPWTGEIGFGGTYDWTDANNVNYGVYGEVTAATGLSGGSYSYGGNLGFRVKW
ncbi:autotransporter outer membrane beta-barrel domain-containing protein [Martelella sp. AMO21009]